MIHVIATIQVKPGTRDLFLEQFRALVPEVCAEPGCIEYGPAVDVATGIPVQSPLRDDVVVVVERWADPAALTAHLSAPHMNAYREKVKDLVVGLSLQVLQPV